MSRLITRFWPHGYFVVWESVWFQLFLFCWKAFRLRCRHAANTQPLGANTGVQATDGTYFIAGENYTTGAVRYAYLLKLAANGDSLWSRIYPQPLTGIFKLYYHKNNLWGMFTTNGSSRLRFAQINESTGDTSNTFFAPHGPASTYTYFDHEVLPNGDYLLLYTSGSASTFCRFTPGSLKPIWQADLAGQVFKATDMFLDGNYVVIAGADGEGMWYDLGVQKFTLDGDLVWDTKIKRNTVNQDYKFGIAKNSQGNYLVAASTGVKVDGIGTWVPSVTTVNSATGDSLKTTILTTYNSNVLASGNCNGIITDGTNHYASGYIEHVVTGPKGPVNVGFMTLFAINDNGDFSSVHPFNNNPVFNSGTGGGSSFAFGNGVFMSNDNNLILFGRGHFLAPNQAWQQAVGTTYVVKLNANGLIGVEENEKVSNIILYPNPAADNAKINYAANTVFTSWLP
jgi:hypothetical protein